jgi:hypothetical protein
MSSTDLASYSAIVLSLLFSYIPKLNTWFDGLDAQYKRLIMLGLCAVVAGAAFGLSCAGWGGEVGLSVTCDKAGALGLLKAFVGAIVANQAAYMLTPRKATAK